MANRRSHFAFYESLYFGRRDEVRPDRGRRLAVDELWLSSREPLGARVFERAASVRFERVYEDVRHFVKGSAKRGMRA